MGRRGPTIEEITDNLLSAVEDVGPVIAFMTGLRQQFIDQGWSPLNAEEAALHICRMAMVSHSGR